MIDEILKEIKEAEERAEAMQKQAYQDGKDIVFNAELNAEAKKRSTIAGCKADTKCAIANAEKEASDKRSAILKEGEIRAEKLVLEKEKAIESMSDKILEMLLERY